MNKPVRFPGSLKHDSEEMHSESVNRGRRFGHIVSVTGSQAIVALERNSYAALREFVVERNLGLVTGADGLVSLISGLVRIPDVAFVSWNRLPERQVPTDPIPHVAPDLAVEVLSKGNTAGEMERKRREYFQAGVRLVWMVDVEVRTVAVFTSAESSRTLNEDQILDGGGVLPGFSLALRELFAELDRQGDR